ncbi:MAG: S8 family serine peptidase [Anaerolineaceae bacterium]|nr:S8 family serine peptidase [Anaerolineaceae bacterium]
MPQRVASIFISIILAIGLVSLLLANAAYSLVGHAAQPNDKIDPALLEALAEGSSVRFIADLSATAVIPTSSPPQHTAVLHTLQQTAATSQANALSQLETLQAAGEVTAVRSLWIVNSIAATGSLTAVQAVASLPEVSQVRLDVVVQEIRPADNLTETLLAGPMAAITGAVASWGIDRINAPAVWRGLGVDGSGVTVAIMDSGVDWQHPDLAANYRGNQGGTVDHSGSWFNAVMPTDTIPVDNIGHGTHVAGTAVGQNGIGVAPGASWIAVNIADPFGLIWESDVHRGFEWLLAPNDDPALAPDVVNNSWGSSVPSTIFVEDIAALHAANIQVVFSAGNSGPFTGTVGYPAGNPGVLSVGASDDLDGVAWFSSRGPSAQTDEIKPWLVAPGTQILSSLPGGVYGLYNGTSMATPHVVGTIALLLSANPGLSRSQVNQILAETAVPIAATHPNMHSGWGRLDAYAAVAQQTSAGTLTGQVTANGLPLPGVVLTITTASAGQFRVTTGEDGRYTAPLQSGSYALAAQPFGYAPFSATSIAVNNGQTTTRNIALTKLPGGQVEGFVRASAGYMPLADARVEVVGTPVTGMTDGNGRFLLNLPSGTYELVVTKVGYQQQRSTIWLANNTTAVPYFILADAPSVLLVDSGQWYYSSQAAQHAEALTALNYSFDTWTVRDPFGDVPALEDLTPYEAVIWSSPLDSPGYLGMNNVITDFLGLGGHLFISGQNIGSYDGVGMDTQLWWYRDLNATLLGKTAVTQTITGSSDSLFAGLSLTLNGGSSSNNQDWPDVSAPRSSTFSQPAFAYEDGRAAGLTAGYCSPFRMVYLGFGLEGVSQAADRATILQQSFRYFEEPRETVGVQFFPDGIDELAIPGEAMNYTVNVFNRSETMTDTFTLSISGAAWPTSLLTQTMTLGPCTMTQTVLTLNVPNGLPPDLVEELTVTAVSHNTPSVSAQLPVVHKIPGHILFVDDDRFYDQTAELTTALDSLNLTYDRWDTGHAGVARNGPSLALLQNYDFVIWYTGYDWFQPITPAENEALTGYLAQGGRLFLTSQDFLYYHYRSALAREYFGVADYEETVEPTRLIGSGHTAVAAEIPEPFPLDFAQYQNHGDGIIPAPHSQPFFWHDRALPAGTATAGAATAGDNWRAVLWAVPFETITPTRQAEAMNRVLGWLSDLGDSSFMVDQRVGKLRQPRTYTITVQQAPGASNSIWLTNTLSAWLVLDPDSLTGGAVYNPATRQLTWAGTLPGGGSHTISYQATPTGILPHGFKVENTLALHDGNHDLTFARLANVWVEAPDVVARVTAVPNQPLAATLFTYTIALENVGLTAASEISAVVSLPNTFHMITNTLTSSAGTPSVGDRRLYWAGGLDVGESITMTLVLTRAATAVPQFVATTALIDDGFTSPTFFSEWHDLPVYSRYFPIVLHKPTP